MLTALLLTQIAAASPPPTRFELPNGLRVWVQEEHSRPVALVHITYHVGSLNEGPGQTGVAHYVEHMVYRATENVRNEDVYGYIDRIGGRYTGGTWPDVTRYAETVPSWAVESALRVTAERMTRARFDSLEFERERSNVVTEAHGFADLDPANALRDAVMMAAFELHPYRYSSNTWARDNLTLTRAQAYAWYKEHYGPNNAVLVIVGDVKTDAVRRLVERHFAPLARAPGTGRIDVVEPPQRAEKRITLTEASDSARLEIAYRMPSAHDRDYPAQARIADLFSAAIKKRVASVDTSIRVDVKDTAMAYPYVHRLSVAAARTVNMMSVLAAIDADATDVRGAAPIATASEKSFATDSSSAAPNSAVPPRRSTWTRMAEALAARETPQWEVSPALHDSLRKRFERVSLAESMRFAGVLMSRTNRTVGILQPTGPRPDTARYAMDVPALTTPPAPRERPEPVPARALEPLAPILIERTARTLPNGVRVRTARVDGSSSLLVRAIIDHGDVLDTLVRPYPVASADEGLRGAVEEIRLRLARRPAVRTDSSVEDRARARVKAAVLPPPVQYADARAPVSVALVGPLPAAQLMALGARHFGTLPSRRSLRLREPFGTVGPREEQIRVSDQKQVEIVAGLPSVHRDHADRRALELLNYIVGVPYYGGRLGWALTKAGLTYSSAAQSYFGESGHIVLSTTADTRNTPAVIQAIREVVGGVGERGVEQWELDEAKAFMLGRMLLYGAREDSPPAVLAAALTDSDATAMDLLDLPVLSRAYLAITLDDVNRVARRYYRSDMLKVVAMGAIPDGDMQSPFAAGTFRALFEPR